MHELSFNKNCFPYNLLSDDALLEIEQSADHILRDVGVELEDDPESLEALRELGASIDKHRVRVEGEKLREFISSHAPKRFFWHAEDPARSLDIGHCGPVFAPVYGPPSVRRLDGSTALGTISDYRDLVALCDQADVLGSTGFMVCYVHDVPEERRHIEMAQAHMELSNKPFIGTIFSPRALNEVVDLVGVDVDVPGECHLLHLINSNPPLVYKSNPLQCLRAASLRGQGCIVESYMMMGSTSPVTVAATVAQGYAEVLIGLALTQLYRAGAPVVMGIYGIPFSMRSMLPVFGDPVSHLIEFVSVQLARRLGIPARGDGGLTSSNINDAQAGYQSAMCSHTAFASGADLILHAAGWLENGRCVDMNKFKTDVICLNNLVSAYRETA